MCLYSCLYSPVKLYSHQKVCLIQNDQLQYPKCTKKIVCQAYQQNRGILRRPPQFGGGGGQGTVNQIGSIAESSAGEAFGRTHTTLKRTTLNETQQKHEEVLFNLHKNTC